MFKVGDKVILRKDTNTTNWYPPFVQYLKINKNIIIVEERFDDKKFLVNNGEFLIPDQFFKLYKSSRLKIKLP